MERPEGCAGCCGVQSLGIWAQHAVLRQQRDLGAEHGVRGIAVQHACEHAAINGHCPATAQAHV